MADSTLDLSTLEWRLAGFIPNDWRNRSVADYDGHAEVGPVPARVPGSIQAALLDAGIIPDWFVGLQARECEWVENRHWILYTALPDEWVAAAAGARRAFLRCEGLDYEGCVRVNGEEAGHFRGSFVPHVFEVGRCLRPTDNVVEIVFTEPPRWLGQLGFTSRMTDWKTRFNYTWDWTSRVVQLGVTGEVVLEPERVCELGDLTCRAGAGGDSDSSGRFSDSSGGVSDSSGWLHVQAPVLGTVPAGASAVVSLADIAGHTVRERSVVPAELAATGVRWDDLPVNLWWPNGEGAQPRYRLSVRLVGPDGADLDRAERTIGFRRIEWRPCEAAPADAEPWLCTVNGRPVFLQGVNWTPIRPDYADVTADQVRARVELYRDLGCNVLRVWGGATLETELFYDLCDEMGLLVWQEFPLSSSGFDNWPPEDETAIAEMRAIAESYVLRRRHHPSLCVWCGGNELQGAPDGGTEGIGRPVSSSHPMIAALGAVVARLDPDRRFLPTSSSGPRFGADPSEFGRGVHHDVHGPWTLPEGSLEGAARYWGGDDALFRSEVGVPGASPADIIEEYAGELPLMPASSANPLWRRTSWWIQWPEFVSETGREPADLGEFVAWSQDRQAKGIALAAESCKRRFPACGGFIVWMGHDSFPCTANTALVDFHGRPKPAAVALREVFRRPAGGAVRT